MRRSSRRYLYYCLRRERNGSENLRTSTGVLPRTWSRKQRVCTINRLRFRFVRPVFLFVLRLAPAVPITDDEQAGSILAHPGSWNGSQTVALVPDFDPCGRGAEVGQCRPAGWGRSPV